MADNRCLERKRVGATILATFLINIFFLVFYVNIQPSCSKTRMKYFNIKLHYYLGKLSRDRLSGENYQRVSAFFRLNTKRTQSSSEKRLFD